MRVYLWTIYGLLRNFGEQIRQVLNFDYSVRKIPVFKAHFATFTTIIALFRAPQRAAIISASSKVRKNRLALVDHSAAAEPATKAATYFQNNLARMNYAHFRKQGYLIGSGTVESGCKQIGTMRLKRSGAQWLEEGARWVAEMAEHTDESAHDLEGIDTRLARVREALEAEPALCVGEEKG